MGGVGGMYELGGSCIISLEPLGRGFQVRSLLQRLVYSFHCLSVNSELEKESHTALNTQSVSPLEKIKEYQAGQTVTCFLKKVSSACHHVMPAFFQKKRRSWRQKPLELGI